MQHIESSHPNLNNFICSVCSGKFPSYRVLAAHQFDSHETGLFKCSKESCPFLAPYRDKVYRHIQREHTTKHQCPHSGCDLSFASSGNLKNHLRTHAQVKPFICRYPKCLGYSAASKGMVVSHVRTSHLKLPQTKKIQVELGIEDTCDPNQFIEVLEHLIDI